MRLSLGHGAESGEGIQVRIQNTNVQRGEQRDGRESDQRIPNMLECQTLEVLGIGRGKMRDTMSLERFRQTNVEDSATRKMAFSGKRPHVIHDIRAIDQLPTRMSPVKCAFPHSSFR